MPLTISTVRVIPTVIYVDKGLRWYIILGYGDPTGNFDFVKAIASFHYAMVLFQSNSTRFARRIVEHN